ncbi:glycoside hydrolase family 61 protein [Chaetomium sp. MPI-CAGE-AT-0009]|nr:glycoside hydrolase family 61 protein [Chaetomium sp. MPI-CAGE-AT-0009]
MVAHASLSAALVGALATTVLGHGMVTSFNTDGKTNQGFILDYYYAKVNGQPVPDIAAWYAENLDSGFVAPNEYQTAHINCHKNATPGTLTATVAAGGTVDFNWPATWPHPYGPILTYIAKCSGDCTKADKSTLKWVKIEEAGIDYATQKWASQTLVDQGGVWSTTVPKSIAPGNYVFRHEIIALHGAGSLNGAQNYPQCFNIQITGSGTANPEGVLGTELYKNTDPGIHFNPYTTITDYKIPGPALFSG